MLIVGHISVTVGFSHPSYIAKLMLGFPKCVKERGYVLRT